MTNAKDYKILTGFKSFASEADIGIGITTSDLIGIYHSTIAGGNLMTDVLYNQNKLPVTGITNVKAVANVNGRIGIFSDNTLYIIEVVDSGGLLTFTVNDTIEYGVKDSQDIAEIQGGIIIHTQNGIFYTNGYDSDLVSTPINNVIRDNFDNGSIVYNKYKRELYYRPDASDDALYRFRFERKVWEYIDTVFGLGGANKLLVDLSGNRAYLTDDSLITYDASDTSTPTAYITLNESDFGEPSVDKLINHIDVDYEGDLKLTLITDNFAHTYTLSDSAARTTTWLDLPLFRRIKFQKITISFLSNKNSPAR